MTFATIQQRAQAGKNLLLRIEDQASYDARMLHIGDPVTYPTPGTAVYMNVGGFKSNGLDMSGEYIDITSKDSNGWKEKLHGAGSRTIAVSGSGVFMSDEALKHVQDCIMNNTIRLWQCYIPGMGIYDGLFTVSSLNLAGELEGEINYSISLEGAGAIGFTEETTPDALLPA